MPTHVIQQLRLAQLGFNVVPFILRVGAKTFNFDCRAPEVHITDTATGENRIGDLNKLLEAFVKDAGGK